jgi:hypothetical protein
MRKVGLEGLTDRRTTPFKVYWNRARNAQPASLGGKMAAFCLHRGHSPLHHSPSPFEGIEDPGVVAPEFEHEINENR